MEKTFSQVVHAFGNDHNVAKEIVECRLNKLHFHRKLGNVIPRHVRAATKTDLSDYPGLELPALVVDFKNGARRLVYTKAFSHNGQEANDLRIEAPAVVRGLHIEDYGPAPEKPTDEKSVTPGLVDDRPVLLTSLFRG